MREEHGAQNSDDPLRGVAQYRLDREIAEGRADGGVDAERGAGASGSGVSSRPRNMSQLERSHHLDTAIDQAILRGEFDDLPRAGKPIPGLKGPHDPDWWLKGLMERERITGLLPGARLRKESGELDATLDREWGLSPVISLRCATL